MRWRRGDTMMNIPVKSNVGALCHRSLPLLEAWASKRLSFTNALPLCLPGRRTSPMYSHVIGLIKCRLGFSLLQSSITCLRGIRSAAGFVPNPTYPEEGWTTQSVRACRFPYHKISISIYSDIGH